MPIPPMRFEPGRPMLLAGPRVMHRYASASEDIPAQWTRFNALCPLPGQVGEVSYGAVCQSLPSREQFEYMTAVEVESFDALPPDIGRMRVPAALYAVFTHHGPVARIRETWDAIWQEWVPSSGIPTADTPDFERYDERFAGESPDSVIEIWLPIQRPA